MKLLVCDDDISTIDVIQSQLDCRQLGISTILRAYNGVMAKEIIDRDEPEDRKSTRLNSSHAR